MAHDGRRLSIPKSLGIAAGAGLLLVALWTIGPWGNEPTPFDPSTAYEITGKAWLLEAGHPPVELPGLTISDETADPWDAPATITTGGHVNFFVGAVDHSEHVMPDTEIRSATGGLAKIEHKDECPPGDSCVITSSFVAIRPLPGTYAVHGSLVDERGDASPIVIEFVLAEVNTDASPNS